MEQVLSDSPETTPESRPNWRAMLNELGVRPSKALGQNFLHDRRIVRRIADTARLDGSEVAVEVGPGLGVLTRELADRAGEVVAIELDRKLAEYLRGGGLPANVRVIERDILLTDVPAIVGDRPYVVVANLPYSVAAAAIQHLLGPAQRPRRMVVMVQREVAERIVARPPEMSVLAVAVQFYAEARIAFRIGSGAFIPAPKVDSAVLELHVRPQLPISEAEVAGFFQIVRAGFGQRRKQLLNSLSAGLTEEKQAITGWLEAAGIDPARRAETLTVDEWVTLCRASATEQ